MEAKKSTLKGQSRVRVYQSIPDELRTERDKILSGMRIISRKKDKSGVAARDFLDVLLPHSQKEDDYAFPLLWHLPFIGQTIGRPTRKRLLHTVREFQRNLPAMYLEHKHLLGQLDLIISHSQQQKTPADRAYYRFAHYVKSHIITEGRDIYPAALMVGEILRVRNSNPYDRLPKH